MRNAVEVSGQGQDQSNFHDLRRLQLKWPKIDPTLRAHANNAHHLHGDEQRQRDRIDQKRGAEPKSDIDERDHQHGEKANAKAGELA